MKQMKKVVLFGDSIFNAYDGQKDTDRLTKALSEQLGDAYEVVNISVSGACAQDVLPRVGSLPACDILVVEYGTNDAASWAAAPMTTRKGWKA
jgi:acyl-CoA thioesterase I